MNERGFLSRIRERGPIKGALIAVGSVGAGGIAVVSASIAESPITPPSFEQKGEVVSRQVKKVPSETATAVLATSTPAVEPLVTVPTLEVISTATFTPEPVKTPEIPIEQAVDWNDLKDRFLGEVSISDFSVGAISAARSGQGIPLGEIVPSDSLAKSSEEVLEEPRQWWENEPPVKVAINVLGIESELIQTEKIPTKDENGNIPEVDDVNVYCVDNDCTWPTPDDGIATPKQLIKSGGNTTVLIYGHSRWNHEQKPFYDLSDLNIGDVIKIEGVSGQEASFTVKELKLVRYGHEESNLYPTDGSQLILQSTAAEEDFDADGNVVGWHWVMDESEMQGRATYLPDSIGGHMAWFVVAKSAE